MSYLGFPVTTAANFIDYYVGEWRIAEGGEGVERLLYTVIL